MHDSGCRLHALEFKRILQLQEIRIVHIYDSNASLGHRPDVFGANICISLFERCNLNKKINIPISTVYRRFVVSAKKNRKISEAFKKLNVGRKLEIANIERKANLTPNDTICDIGCGDGFWSYYFSKLAKEIVAVDPYSNDLTHAQNRYASKRLFFLQSVAILSTTKKTCEIFDMTLLTEL